jgi:hypothetical protein
MLIEDPLPRIFENADRLKWSTLSQHPVFQGRFSIPSPLNSQEYVRLTSVDSIPISLEVLEFDFPFTFELNSITHDVLSGKSGVGFSVVAHLSLASWILQKDPNSESLAVLLSVLFRVFHAHESDFNAQVLLFAAQYSALNSPLIMNSECFSILGYFGTAYPPSQTPLLCILLEYFARS